MNDHLIKAVGLVAIGRNEGPRLRCCLESVAPQVQTIVYVDSGSTDDSVDFARSIGAHAIQLDMNKPFTAARSRNAGVARLREVNPNLEFVQVVDGDCEIVEGWLDASIDEIRANPRAAVVCGRRRERFPDQSVYNRICDMEWNTPIGQASACGGDALIRITAFAQVGGFDESLIAGEEPEMCLRLRRAGWTIHRIDRDMTLHDANITRFSQWWKRNVRSGHAYAEGRAMHGRTHGYCVREMRSILEWTVLLPLIAFGLAWLTWGVSLFLLGGYMLLWHRVRRHRLMHGDSPSDATLYAQHCVLGKFAQLVGAGRYWWNRLRGHKTRLIEYKRDSLPAATVPVAAHGRNK